MTSDNAASMRTPSHIVTTFDSSMAKTLHIGLQALETICSHPSGLTVTEIAEAIDVHRTVAHRLLRTLETHGLCRRDNAKRFLPGAALVTLSEQVERDLRTLARPILEELAERVGATAHLVTQENTSSVRVLMVVEPRQSRVHIAFQPGRVDDIDRGSAGLAILAAGPALADERAEVTLARQRGYASSYGEQIPFVHGLSVNVPGRPHGAAISIGISVFELKNEDALGTEVIAAARRLSALLS